MNDTKSGEKANKFLFNKPSTLFINFDQAPDCRGTVDLNLPAQTFMV